MDRNRGERLAVVEGAFDPFDDQILEIRIDLARPAGARSGSQSLDAAVVPADHPLVQGRRMDLQQLADVTDASPEQAVTDRLQPHQVVGITSFDDGGLHSGGITKTRIGTDSWWHILKITVKERTTRDIEPDFQEPL